MAIAPSDFESKFSIRPLRLVLIKTMTQATTTPGIQLTETALQHVLALREQQGKDLWLRVGVRQGGCSGMSYKLDFDTEEKDSDKSFEDFGTRLVIDPTSYLYLAGMTLDYEGGLNGKGFIFTNPNASRTCGCGSSFGV